LTSVDYIYPKDLVFNLLTENFLDHKPKITVKYPYHNGKGMKNQGFLRKKKGLLKNGHFLDVQN